MALLPKPKLKRIAFYRSHLSPFAENALAIGTTPEAVADLSAKVAEAREARLAQRQAMSAARAATSRFNTAISAMNAAGASIIAQVRTQAQTTGNRDVYNLALLPPPASRSPIGEPGTPSAFEFELHGAGLLVIKWRCKNPKGSTGTMYQVYRRLSPTGEYTYLGATGSKSFLDSTIPPGASNLTYRIQAIRSTKVGTAATFNVTFGRIPDGIPLPTLLPRKKAVARAA